jgi:flagellar biosynthesis anti-sigma factor FlgM
MNELTGEMNQEHSSTDSSAATGVMDAQAAATAPPGSNADILAQIYEARFSSIEATVEHLEALTLSIPDLRMARVLELKAQIDAGTYDVPAERLAAALFEYMQVWGD